MFSGVSLIIIACFRKFNKNTLLQFALYYRVQSITVKMGRPDPCIMGVNIHMAPYQTVQAARIFRWFTYIIIMSITTSMSLLMVGIIIIIDVIDSAFMLACNKKHNIEHEKENKRPADKNAIFKILFERGYKIIVKC